MNDETSSSYETLISMFKQQGSLSAIFEAKNEAFLRSSFDRTDYAEELLNKHNSIVGPILYSLYSIWLSFINILFAPKDVGVKKAQLMYSTLCSHISHFEIEPVEETQTERRQSEVTFFAHVSHAVSKTDSI